MIKTYFFTCPICGELHAVDAPSEEFAQWEKGAMAQDAFKSLMATQREQIISHLCPTCQKEIFG